LETAQAMFLSDESDVLVDSVEVDENTFDNIASSLSREDRRTYSLMSQSIEFVDGHYQLSLPWRHDFQVLPNNLKTVEKRLMGLRCRLLKDPEIREKYVEQMRIMIEKGYAEKVPEGEIQTRRRTWYIPHHGVVNDKKPGKLRVIFDYAAVHQGVSLNQVLMQGPDLNNRLDGVLLRFRKESIALVADVEAMFYQI